MKFITKTIILVLYTIFWILIQPITIFNMVTQTVAWLLCLPTALWAYVWGSIFKDDPDYDFVGGAKKIVRFYPDGFKAWWKDGVKPMFRFYREIIEEDF